MIPIAPPAMPVPNPIAIDSSILISTLLIFVRLNEYNKNIAGTTAINDALWPQVFSSFVLVLFNLGVSKSNNGTIIKTQI